MTSAASWPTWRSTTLRKLADRAPRAGASRRRQRQGRAGSHHPRVELVRSRHAPGPHMRLNAIGSVRTGDLPQRLARTDHHLHRARAVRADRARTRPAHNDCQRRDGYKHRNAHSAPSALRHRRAPADAHRGSRRPRGHRLPAVVRNGWRTHRLRRRLTPARCHHASARGRLDPTSELVCREGHRFPFLLSSRFTSSRLRSPLVEHLFVTVAERTFIHNPRTNVCKSVRNLLS